eukprot:TRINITY_DN446_c0_g1_i6.p3 TRINITY_DN446_c0_g1~~TRINITY_DN446_c0_g1_i6.p3  ORF type:complete len:127 (+),score=19.03 TRINITY_DN446_c0_g1_i6:75-455(+)
MVEVHFMELRVGRSNMKINMEQTRNFQESTARNFGISASVKGYSASLAADRSTNRTLTGQDVFAFESGTEDVLLKFAQLVIQDDGTIVTIDCKPALEIVRTLLAPGLEMNTVIARLGEVPVNLLGQ